MVTKDEVRIVLLLSINCMILDEHSSVKQKHQPCG